MQVVVVVAVQVVETKGAANLPTCFHWFAFASAAIPTTNVKVHSEFVAIAFVVESFANVYDFVVAKFAAAGAT